MEILGQATPSFSFRPEMSLKLPYIYLILLDVEKQSNIYDRENVKLKVAIN